MKYQCDNCQICCIYSSSSVSYCGLTHQCQAIKIKVSTAIGISFVSVFLFAFGLFALYALFRNRVLPAAPNKPIEIGRDFSEKPAQNVIVGVTKQKMKTVKQTEIEDRSNKKKKGLMKYSKFTKSTNTHQTQTERIMR